MLITLETILPFGKYKGEQFEDIIHDDPNYVEWLVNNTTNDYDEETLELLNSKKIT